MSSSSPEKLKDHHQQRKEYQLEYFLLDFNSFFEYFNNWSEIDGREDRGESWALVYSNIGVKEWRGETVLGIKGGLTQMVAVKETYDVSIKTSFL